MLGWMILPFRRYVDFAGRSRRLEFWAFALFVGLVYLILGMVLLGSGLSINTVIERGEDSASSLVSLMLGGSGVLLSIWWLVTLVPSIAVTVRRLHDRDLSGWWYLAAIVAGAIPLLNVLSGLALLVVLLLPGTPGPNRFGPDPKDPTGADVFA
jgi:uncharacterized membrane protein YhaH (DUF805 family)